MTYFISRKKACEFFQLKTVRKKMCISKTAASFYAFKTCLNSTACITMNILNFQNFK